MKLTLKNLRELPADSIFQTGLVKDDPDGLNFMGNGELLVYVAVKGYVNDWTIYVLPHPATIGEVALHGDKVATDHCIKYLVDCTDEVLRRYRH